MYTGHYVIMAIDSGLGHAATRQAPGFASRVSHAVRAGSCSLTKLKGARRHRAPKRLHTRAGRKLLALGLFVALDYQKLVQALVQPLSAPLLQVPHGPIQLAERKLHCALHSTVPRQHLLAYEAGL